MILLLIERNGGKYSSLQLNCTCLEPLCSLYWDEGRDNGGRGELKITCRLKHRFKKKEKHLSIVLYCLITHESIIIIIIICAG